MDGQVDDGWTDKRINGWLDDERMSVWIDGWELAVKMDRWMDRWMTEDRRGSTPFCFSSY